MKYLYYNPFELPEKIHIVSECFEINSTYLPEESQGKPCDMEQLFILSQSDCFEQVEVYVTSHNEVYFKNSKKYLEGYALKGWIDLKKFKNGGGYLNDSVAKVMSSNI